MITFFDIIAYSFEEINCVISIKDSSGFYFFLSAPIDHARYAAYEPVITVSRTHDKIRISCVAVASFANTLSELNSPCTAMHPIRLPLFRYIITNINPAAVAYTTWSRFGNSSAPEPFTRLIICPIPKVTLDTITAALKLSLRIAPKRRPRNISSSKNPTHSMDGT